MIIHYLPLGVVLAMTLTAAAQTPIQLDDACCVTVGNQEAQVGQDGVFVIQNIPVFRRVGATADVGPQLYRVRATCMRDGQAITGQSEFFELTPGQTTFITSVMPSEITPIPTSISVSAPADVLPAGQTVQLGVTAAFADGSTEDRTPRATGTTYLSTNTSLLTVTNDGLVTGQNTTTSPQQATIIVLNEGNIASIAFTAVGLSNDFDGDGMPNDFEDLFGLNKLVNDADLDLDNDGLTNIEEFNLGTIVNNPDTDADGIIDGLDGDPLHPEESPPVVAITSPADGDTLREGQTIRFSVDASDDGLLTGVTLATDTGFSQLFTEPPFEVEFLVPTGVTEIVFSATATDSVPNTASTAATVSVIPDPLTTVTGSVVDTDGNPVEGAMLTTNGGVMGTTSADGVFSLPAVPTILGDIIVRASANPGGMPATGISAALPPNLGAVTDVGIIVLRRGCAIVAKTTSNSVDLIDLASSCVLRTIALGADALDVDVTPDGTTALVSSFDPSPGITFLDLQATPPEIIGFLALPFASEDIDITCTSTGFAVITDGGIAGQIGAADVASVDIGTRSLISSLSLPVGAQGNAVSPDGSLVLVNSLSSDAIRVLLLSPTGALTDTGLSVSSGGTGPVNVTISPTGQLALVANSSSNTVGLLRLSSASAESLASINLDTGSQSIVFSPEGSLAYILPAFGGDISILSIDPDGNVADTGDRITGIDTAIDFFGVDQLAITADGQRLVVHTPGEVTIIDTLSNTILNQIMLTGDTGGANGAGGGISIMSCPVTTDCNSNGIPDACDITGCDGSPDCGDCNSNGIPDECDISSGTSQDANNNGIPDECEI